MPPPLLGHPSSKSLDPPLFSNRNESQTLEFDSQVLIQQNQPLTVQVHVNIARYIKYIWVCFPPATSLQKRVSYSFIFRRHHGHSIPKKSLHGDYNQRLVMFDFQSDLSQLPSHRFLLISFTYVTVIKGAHLSFLVAGGMDRYFRWHFP